MKPSYVITAIIVGLLLLIFNPALLIAGVIGAGGGAALTLNQVGMLGEKKELGR